MPTSAYSLWRPVEPLSQCIANTGAEAAVATEATECGATDAELGADLSSRDPAGGEQALLEAGELGRCAYPPDADGVEGFTRACAETALVELVGDLGVGVLVEQHVDLPPYVLVSGAQLLSREWAGHRQRGGRAAPETDVGGDLALFEERDVLDDQREHSFALTRWDIWVAPDGGKVVSEGA